MILRIFGKIPGHKSKKRDPYQLERPLTRINTEPIPSLCQVTVNTDGSATNNRWENTLGGIGVWYNDGSRRNIMRKIETHHDRPPSNSRAELSAILETLRQNETNDLIIQSDSLASLRAICKDSLKYEDQDWNGVQNTDLLKGILIRLTTRPAQTKFQWVKGHDINNYRNSRADALADEGREQDIPVEMDTEEWLDRHPAIQDRARLQALEAKHTYSTIVRWHTKKTKWILHQGTLDEAKDEIQGVTGL